MDARDELINEIYMLYPRLDYIPKKYMKDIADFIQEPTR